jgi:hypothetical protein
MHLTLRIVAGAFASSAAVAHASEYDAASHTCSAAVSGEGGTPSSQEATADCRETEARAPLAVSYGDTQRADLAWAECQDCAGATTSVVQLTVWCFDADRGLSRLNSAWSHVRSLSLSCPATSPELWYHTVRTRF